MGFFKSSKSFFSFVLRLRNALTQKGEPLFEANSCSFYIKLTSNLAITFLTFTQTNYNPLLT